MAGNGYEKRWETESILGSGGQGKVFRVVDKTKVQPIEPLLTEFIRAIRDLTAGVYMADQRKKDFDSFVKTMRELLRRDESPVNRGALKILHSPEVARDSATADERIRREISAMQTVKHPNLVEILDANADEQWYVSRYYSDGSLDTKSDRFKGNCPSALRAFRGLVEGVATLHKAKFVHRDIKPQNIFVAADGSLVLGDFGLVFFQDETHTRISETLGNVGTRAWMPPWAMERRVEDLRPTFDVFSLGKVLWSMVSGRETLPFWYFNKSDRHDLNVEKLFPGAPAMDLANELFAKCIAEEESQILESAEALLGEVDRITVRIERGGSRLGNNIVRHCRVCGIGKYKLEADGPNVGRSDISNFGLNPIGNQSFKIFYCEHCGHVQLFSRNLNSEPPAWKN